MKKLALGLALLSIASPVLAHVESTPHVHGYDGVAWAVALVAATLVAIRQFRKRN